MTPDTTDELVADKQVRREFGNQSEMTTHRWDKSPEMAELGWPAAIRINGRKYRSRKALDQFRANCVNRATAERDKPVPAAEDRALVKELLTEGGTITTECGLPLWKVPPAAKKIDIISPPGVADLPKAKSAHSPIDLCAMEVRRIVLGAIRSMSAGDAAALIAELRDELNDIEQVANRAGR